MKKLFSRLIARMKGEQNLDKLIRRGLVVGTGFTKMGGVIIDPSHCWHITIGDNVTIGANTVVNKDVPSGCTVVGNPARIVKQGGERVDLAL